jgi:hypothetical protein
MSTVFRGQNVDISRSKIFLAFLSITLTQPLVYPSEALDAPAAAPRPASTEGAFAVSGNGRRDGSSGGKKGSTVSPDLNGAHALRERMERD